MSDLETRHANKEMMDPEFTNSVLKHIAKSAHVL